MVIEWILADAERQTEKAAARAVARFPWLASTLNAETTCQP